MKINKKARLSSLKNSAYGILDAAVLYNAQYSNGKTIRFDIDNNKIYTPVNISTTSSYNHDISNTWQYTGASVTIPENSYYILTTRAVWNHGKPYGIALMTISDNMNGNYLCYNSFSSESYTDTAGNCTGSGVTGNSPITYYSWIKRAGAGTNNGFISGFYIKKD